MKIEGIDHVQLAMPPGKEKEAREFYSVVLGIPEVDKPSKLSSRGGAWFEAGDLRVHLGVEVNFLPSRKAHPAFRVDSLEALIERLKLAGVEVIEDDLIPGVFRAYADDPFGNRLEFMAPRP
jgi:catechol 2,3-dioxygenase-like lactoylglutathione lyase family enzyme